MTTRGLVRLWTFVIALLALLLFAAWASDFITMQGERTIYTVECKQGAWNGDACAGTLVPGLRYRYRALKPHREVIFWTLGTKDRSGKFDECDIDDGRNWVCRPNADVARSITLQMHQGEPVAGAATRGFRAVSKWRWMLLERGIALGDTVAPAVRPPASAASGV